MAIPMSGGYVAQPASAAPASPAPQPATAPTPTTSTAIPMSGGYVAQPATTTPQQTTQPPLVNPNQNYYQTNAGSTPQQGTPTPTSGTPTPTNTQPALTMPVNGSVVDLLNMAGTDSSFAARKQMAEQYGMQGYTGTAAQNQELANKFINAYNAKKSSTVPESPADARGQLDEYFAGQDDTSVGPADKRFFDSLSSMNPVERNIFEGFFKMLSPQNTKQTLTQLFAEETAKMGIPGLQTELADLNRIMDGTEDDIRDEINRAGGGATESQVKALAGARNKTLIRQAQYLSDLIDTRKEYVDQIMSLTQADREEVEREVDRKLGIGQAILTFSDRLETRARENYQNIIKDIGYNGLVGNITSPQDLQRVASALGMSPKTLLSLSKVKTNAQREMELSEMSYQLSVDKFNEDKRQFGLQYALEKQKLANQQAANMVISPFQEERGNRVLTEVDDLLPRVSKDTVGVGSLKRFIPGSSAADFAADVEELKANIFSTELTAMREASKTGGAVGNVSDQEGDRLASSLGALSLSQSPESFTKNLREVKDSIYSWRAQVMAIQYGFNYQNARASTNPDTGQPYTNEQIYQYLKNR